MTNLFPYLRPESAAPQRDATNITQPDESTPPLPRTPDEHFDEAADAIQDDEGADGGGEWILPDPATLPQDPPRTPLDRLIAAALRASSPRTQQPAPGTAGMPASALAPGELDTGYQRTPPTPGEPLRPGNHTTGPSVSPSTSSLVRVCQQGGGMKTSGDIIAFLDWQASRRGDGEA